MNITECFQMRKRRSIDKTPGRSHDATGFPPRSPVGRLRRTTHGPVGSGCNNSFSDQCLEIVWDNNSPSPARTLSLGKRKKHHGSDSSSSGGEISDLVQKLADKSGHTPEVNPPLLAFWMSRDGNTAVEKSNSNATVVKRDNASKQKSKEFQTPSRRPRRVLRKCNKSKMKLLKKDIELLAHPMEKTEDESSVLNKVTIQDSSEQQEELCNKEAGVLQCIAIKPKSASDNYNNFSTSGGANFFDVWDTDEDDLILSQVDIPFFKNNIPETQVMTNTQLLDSGEDTFQCNVSKKSVLSKDHCNATHVDSHDSIVTESWDFVDDLGDSDDENILQCALEDFEKSQQVSVPTVRRLSNLHVKPSLLHINACDGGDLLPKGNQLEQTKSVARGSKDNSSMCHRNLLTEEKCSRKEAYSFLPRSTLHSTVTRSESLTTQQHGLRSSCNSVTSSNTSLQRIEKEQQNFQNVSEKNVTEGNVSKQKDSATLQMLQKGTSAAKPARYSKEEIERKKLEAQNRRRQKMALSQQKHHN